MTHPPHRQTGKDLKAEPLKEGMMEYLTKVNGRQGQFGETHAHSVACGRHPRHFRARTE